MFISESELNSRLRLSFPNSASPHSKSDLPHSKSDLPQNEPPQEIVVYESHTDSSDYTDSSDSTDSSELESSESNESESHSSESNLTVKSHSRYNGRPKRSGNIPQFMLEILGTADRLSGPTATAKEFGKNIAHVSEIGHGRVGGVEKPELKSAIERNIGKAQDLAVDKLMSALGLLSPERIANSKAKDISSIATDMARIIEKTSPKQTSDHRTQVVIYAPSQKQESFYDVVPSV